MTRKYDQKSKELEKTQDSLGKLQKTLADQQLLISQTRQSQMDSKMSMTNELRLLEKTTGELRSSLNSCSTLVCGLILFAVNK